MDTKLTLELNQDLIEKAKVYASNKQMSLSRIIETYLQSMVTETMQFEISPFVASITNGNTIHNDLDLKNKYSEHLLDKYK